jgi:hypothetical protein
LRETIFQIYGLKIEILLIPLLANSHIFEVREYPHPGLTPGTVLLAVGSGTMLISVTGSSQKKYPYLHDQRLIFFPPTL